MFLNRKEQIAALVLCGTLCVGAVASYLRNRYPGPAEEFGVVKGAVKPPGEAASSDSMPKPSTGKDATVVASPDTAPGSVIDINRATPEALERLPRIGPAVARRIVDDRTRNGPFKRVDDLKRVKGIGEKTLEKIRPFVKAGD